MEFVEGFVSVFAGALSLLHDKAYVGRLSLPILANLVALTASFAALFWGSWTVFDGLVAGWIADDGILASVLGFAGGVLSLVLATVTLWFTAPVLIETVLGPFLDPLAQATEEAWTGRPSPALDLGFWNSLLQGLRASSRILALQLVLLLPLLLLSLTGVGALLAMLVGAYCNAIVWFEIPCGRRGLSLRERRALIRRNWPRAVGLGLGFQVGLLIPLFNFLLLTPATAVAASAQFFRLDRRA
jgi:uncharacterized protein involved in cysteine biosynthesis